MRVTVGMVVGLVAAGKTTAEILELYPYLEEEDVRQALAYVASRWSVAVDPGPVPIKAP